MNKKASTALPADVAIPLDNNVHCVKGQLRMHHDWVTDVKMTRYLVKMSMVPVVLSVNGVIPKRTMKALRVLEIG